MKIHHRHLNLARRKMGRVIDELYSALLRCGGDEVNMHILREKGGLRLLVQSDFNADAAEEIERMQRLIRPKVRSAAMVEMYWELAGEDQYTGEGEIALVGQIADEAEMTVEDGQTRIELFIAY